MEAQELERKHKSWRGPRQRLERANRLGWVGGWATTSQAKPGVKDRKEAEKGSSAGAKTWARQ